VLYGLILVVHILACFFLVAVILLQAGRGGGLSDVFGGAAQSMFGTRGAVYLTRATTGFAILFMLTSLSLAILSAQRGRSLMERASLVHTQAKQPPPSAVETPTPPPSSAPTSDQPSEPATPSHETPTPPKTETQTEPAASE